MIFSKSIIYTHIINKLNDNNSSNKEILERLKSFLR